MRFAGLLGVAISKAEGEVMDAVTIASAVAAAGSFVLLSGMDVSHVDRMDRNIYNS